MTMSNFHRHFTYYKPFKCNFSISRTTTQHRLLITVEGRDDSFTDDRYQRSYGLGLELTSPDFHYWHGACRGSWTSRS